jgi:hypothetical protein
MSRGEVLKKALDLIGAERFVQLKIVDVIIHGSMDGVGIGNQIEFKVIDDNQPLSVFVEVVDSSDPNMHGWLGIAVKRLLEPSHDERWFQN